MSGRGETPEENGEENVEPMSVGPGETLYTDDGRPVGHVRGIEKGGLFGSLREGVESLSIEHAHSGQAFGEAELMWRCMECSEMGELDEDIPESCPSCSAARENLMYWTED
jgi:hypothetical protein